MVISDPVAPTRRFARPLATVLLLLAAAIGALGLFDRIERAVLPVTLAQTAALKLEANLARAAALFATARTMNAAISVAQSVEVSAGVGVQGAVSPGQVLDPVNDVVERFSDLMLTATVALGGSRLLVQAGDLFGLSALLPPGLVLVALALWIRGDVGAGLRRAGLLLLVATIVAKLGLPVAVLATEAVADRLLEPQIAAAGDRLELIDVPGMTGVPEAETGWWDRLSALNDIPAQMRRAVLIASELAEIVVDLTVGYSLKIVVLPLLTLWLVARIADLLIGGLLPRR